MIVRGLRLMHITLSLWGSVGCAARADSFRTDTTRIKRINRNARAALAERNLSRAKQLATVAIDSSLLVGYQMGLAEGLYNYGVSLQRGGLPAEALRYYHRAKTLVVKEHPLSADILRNFGNCHNDLGNYDSALVYFNRLLQWARQKGLVAEQGRAGHIIIWVLHTMPKERW